MTDNGEYEPGDKVNVQVKGKGSRWYKGIVMKQVEVGLYQIECGGRFYHLPSDHLKPRKGIKHAK